MYASDIPAICLIFTSDMLKVCQCVVVAIKVANEAFEELSDATSLVAIEDTLCSKK